MGTELGRVADVSVDEDGRPDHIRVRISTPLGFGERTVEVSRSSYVMLRGRVVLELSLDELRSLPDIDDEILEKQSN